MVGVNCATTVLDYSFNCQPTDAVGSDKSVWTPWVTKIDKTQLVTSEKRQGFPRGGWGGGPYPIKICVNRGVPELYVEERSYMTQ